MAFIEYKKSQHTKEKYYSAVLLLEVIHQRCHMIDYKNLKIVWGQEQYRKRVDYIRQLKSLITWDISIEIKLKYELKLFRYIDSFKNNAQLWFVFPIASVSLL